MTRLACGFPFSFVCPQRNQSRAEDQVRSTVPLIAFEAGAIDHLSKIPPAIPHDEKQLREADSALVRLALRPLKTFAQAFKRLPTKTNIVASGLEQVPCPFIEMRVDLQKKGDFLFEDIEVESVCYLSRV